MNASHILVVDDEPDIRTLLKEILEDEGFEVRVAENAEQARAARRERRRVRRGRAVVEPGALRGDHLVDCWFRVR